MDAGFLNHAVVGIPLMFVVLGLVEFCKKFKRSDGSALICGNDLLLISLGWGLLIGFFYMLSVNRPPVGDWWVAQGYWFGLVFYGLAIGLVASGLYDTVKGLVDRVVKTAILKD